MFDFGPDILATLHDSRAHLPTKGSADAAGFDLYCMDHVTVSPGSRGLIDTGVSVAIPTGWYGRVAPRSGLAVRHALAVHAGVVDADYRGTIKVALFNHGDQAIDFGPGDRIAQLVIERCSTGVMVQVNELPGTARGDGALGSTGR